MSTGAISNGRKISAMVVLAFALVWFQNCSSSKDSAANGSESNSSLVASIAMLDNSSPPQVAAYATPLTVQFDGAYTGVAGNTPIDLTYLFTLNVATGAVVDALGNTDYYLTSHEMSLLLGMLSNSVYADYSQVEAMQGHLVATECDPAMGVAIFPYAIIATNSAGSINVWDNCPNQSDLYSLSTLKTVGLDTFLINIQTEAEAAKGN